MLMDSGAFVFFCCYGNAFVVQNSIIKAEFNSSYGDWCKVRVWACITVKMQVNCSCL